MKKEERRQNWLAILTAMASLCGCGLWLADLAFNGKSTLVVGMTEIPLTICGAVLSLVIMGLVAALLSSFQRCMKQEREEQDAALVELEKLHSRELEQARAAAKQEMETFRSSISHSLRMPVAIIQGYAELLAGGMITSEETRKEYLEKIVQRSLYMSDVMSRHLSAEESISSEKLSCGKLDLLDLIRKAAADIQKAAEEKDIVVQVISQEKSVVLSADGSLLNRVLFNLLENALKYMGRPGVVTIRVVRQENMVSVMVRDDGLGLAPEEAARVFEPRYQGSNRSGGSGYGLYLVKQAVEAHGGIVTAQSAPGRGMGITMTLPIKQEEYQHDNP